MGVPALGKSGNLLQLGVHHRSMARKFVFGGKTAAQLADEYGFTYAQVSKIIATPLFQAEVARLESLEEATMSQVKKDLMGITPLAVEVLADNLVLPEIERKIKTETAFGVLKMTGFAPKEQTENKHVHLHRHLHENAKNASPQDLHEAVMGLVGAQVEDGEVVEVGEEEDGGGNYYAQEANAVSEEGEGFGEVEGFGMEDLPGGYRAEEGEAQEEVGVG